MEERAVAGHSLETEPQVASEAVEQEPAPDAPAQDPAVHPEAPARPADLCQRFGLSPYVLRGLLDDYGDWLPQVEGGLPPQAVERLAAIVRWRAEGLPPDAIRARLDDGQKVDEPFVVLSGRMAELQAALSRSEEHRAQDRDRLMMALVRTQQEIQHLRHELSDRPTRRDRHKGFWRRLLDR